MEVVNAIHGRRSVRSYLPKPVECELIENIIWDAALVPRPFCGEVPWTLNVVEGVDRIAALRSRAMIYVQEHYRSTDRTSCFQHMPEDWGLVG
jgi:nitroreductase